MSARKWRSMARKMSVDRRNTGRIGDAALVDKELAQ